MARDPSPILINCSRRGFLRGGARVGGGLVLGLALPGAGGAAVETPAALGAYIQITRDDRVILYTPGAEMGQGVASSLPKIVAEDLEVDWSRVEIRLSPGAKAFESPKIHRQRSGNSDAVSTYYDGLRQVGAAARDMLITAAAARWSVPVETCRAEGGAVIHGPSGRRLRYGALARAAAALTPPANPRLKPASEFRLIGRSLPRKDIPDKVTGAAIFGIDVVLPDMLHAAIRHCPIKGGRITGDNRDVVLKRPGVRAVVDLPGAVAVVADRYWIALQASLALDLSVAPPDEGLLSTDGIDRSLLAALDADDRALSFPQTDLDKPNFTPLRTDPAAARAALADPQFTADYSVPYLAHATLEPPCCTALVTASACTVWGPLQAGDTTRALVIRMTGLPEDAVTLNRTYLGGGFGRKWEEDFLAQSVAIAMALPGRPVKLIWSREEDLQNDAYRPAHRVRTRARLSPEGDIIAMHSRITGQSIYGQKKRPLPPGLADPAAAAWLIPDAYDFPHKLIDYVEVKLPIPVGFWRSVGQSQNVFFAETVMDELAVRAGRDPLAFRLALLGRRPRMRAVLLKAAEAAGWGEALPPGRGRGIALSYTLNSACAQVVEVSVADKRLRVDKVTAAFDCGLQIEPDTIRAQIEGAIVFGLTAALGGAVPFADGRAAIANFSDYPMIKMATCPEIAVHLIASDNPPDGVGEAGVPGVAPALGNALFAATGDRVRRLPLSEGGYAALDL